MTLTALRLATIAACLCCAAITQAAELNQNLVVNAGAEAGVSGWTGFGGVDLFSAVDYGPNWVLPTQPGPADRGLNLFVGGSTAYAAGFQVLDLTGIPAAQLSGGQLGYALSGWLGGWLSQTDNTQVTAQFFDLQNTLVGSAILGPNTAADRGDQTGLTLFSASGTVPLNTHSITLVMEMTRLEGSDNDGYADNLSFTLAPVPEPAPLALLSLGLCVLGARVARQRRAA